MYTCDCIQYLLDQTPLSISLHSQFVAAPQDVLRTVDGLLSLVMWYEVIT